jgi:hypothetical protein
LKENLREYPRLGHLQRLHHQLAETEQEPELLMLSPLEYQWVGLA